MRRIAVISAAKIHRLDATALNDYDVIDQLYDMLQDHSAEVAASCVCSLNEMLGAEGGMACNKAVLMHLLNRIADFHEWHQCIVLDTITRYLVSPAARQEISDDDSFDILVCRLLARLLLQLSGHSIRCLTEAPRSTEPARSLPSARQFVRLQSRLKLSRERERDRGLCTLFSCASSTTGPS